MTKDRYRDGRAARQWLGTRMVRQRAPGKAEKTRQDQKLDKSFASGKLVAGEVR